CVYLHLGRLSLICFSRSSAPPVFTPFPTRRSSDLRIWRICHNHPYIPRFLLIGTLVVFWQAFIQIAGLRLIHLEGVGEYDAGERDRKSTRLNSSHVKISYAVFCLNKNTQVIGISSF